MSYEEPIFIRFPVQFEQLVKYDDSAVVARPFLNSTAITAYDFLQELRDDLFQSAYKPLVDFFKSSQTQFIVRFLDEWYVGFSGTCLMGRRQWGIYVPLASRSLGLPVSLQAFESVAGIRENVELFQGVEYAGFFPMTFRSAGEMQRLHVVIPREFFQSKIIFEARNGDMLIVTESSECYWFVLELQELRSECSTTQIFERMAQTLAYFGRIDYWNMQRFTESSDI